MLLPPGSMARAYLYGECPSRRSLMTTVMSEIVGEHTPFSLLLERRFWVTVGFSLAAPLACSRTVGALRLDGAPGGVAKAFLWWTSPAGIDVVEMLWSPEVALVLARAIWTVRRRSRRYRAVPSRIVVVR